VNPCLYCDEDVDHGDEAPTPFRWIQRPNGMEPIHEECFFRILVGSVAHQMQACPCYGGTVEDPPSLSKRDAARLAYHHFKRDRETIQ
jgi:hypothetical protein